MGRRANRPSRLPAPLALLAALLATLALALGCGSYPDRDERPGASIVAAPQAGATGADGPRPQTAEPGRPEPGFRAAADQLCRESARDLERGFRSLPAAGSDLSQPFIDVMGPFSADLRALGPPPELVPALDRIDALVADAEANPERLFGTGMRSLERMTAELEAISRGFARAGLRDCGI